MDDLTRAIVEALGCAATLNDDGDYRCAEHGDWIDEFERCPEGTRIAAALAPVIEARVREARADALTDAADAWTQGAWASTPRHKDRVADRMAASQYAGDWLRERAEEARR